MSQNPWGGRFASGLDPLALAMSNSLTVDREMAREDVEGSLAHAAMLTAQGILSPEEGRALKEGLLQIQEEISSGTFPYRDDLEDIHMNIEARLTELVGPVGGKLHTARSRNDQVVTDFRLAILRRGRDVLAALKNLQRALVDTAEAHLGWLMPGYTHLQRAQPIALSHWAMAYYQMTARDRGRLQDALARLNECPLGAAALAGTPWPIDREATARALGFARPMANSLDAVASRDFALEVLSALAIAQSHLSRLAEDLILYSSQEFGFVQLPDQFSTGSSIMPQKKNPDFLELIRGKTGRIYGDLVSLLTLVKGLPMAYNRDLQEDKAPVFDALAQYRLEVELLAALLPGLAWQKERMAVAAGAGFILATELADQMAIAGTPFREAHHQVGELVRELEARGQDLSQLPEAPSLQAAVESRRSLGGTALTEVKAQIKQARRELESA